MVSFGLIEEWQPAPGRLVSWHATPAAVAAADRAPRHPVPPSHQQEEYLRLAHRNVEATFRFSGLCVVTAAVPGLLDRGAMTRAINAFLLRHDTFRSWFAIGTDGAVHRHLVAPEVVEFAERERGLVTGAQIRAHVQESTPGPFRWNCFTFGAVEHENSTTLYLAVDHLHTDGVAQYISCFELAHLYLREVGADTGQLSAPASFLDYCARERTASAALTRTSPGVRRWLELLRGNGGELPSFLLDLGKRPGSCPRSAHRTFPLFDEAAALRFEKVCRDHGAEFTGGIFAAAALAERELLDSDYYFTLSPISTRSTVAELVSVGWYVTLIPVAFPLGATATFARTLTAAQRAYDTGLTLTPVSPHRVLQLAADDPDITVRPGWSAPMLSYVDARDFTGNEYFDTPGTGIYANRAATEQVLLWINRLPTATTLSVIYPDTPTAHHSVTRYISTLRSIMRSNAAS